MGVRIASDRRYEFSADRSAVWDALADVSDYPTWWPWLQQFDGRALDRGQCWRCTIRSPLGIRLRFDLRVAFVTEGEQIGAILRGDLEGTASVVLADRPAGTEVRLVSALAPHKPALASLTTGLPWIGRWAHDRLLDTAANQFSAAARAR